MNYLRVISLWFIKKGNCFSCNKGFCQVFTLRVASGILPAMFFLFRRLTLFSFYLCSHSKAEKVKFSE